MLLKIFHRVPDNFSFFFFFPLDCLGLDFYSTSHNMLDTNEEIIYINLAY